MIDYCVITKDRGSKFSTLEYHNGFKFMCNLYAKLFCRKHDMVEIRTYVTSRKGVWA